MGAKELPFSSLQPSDMMHGRKGIISDQDVWIGFVVLEADVISRFITLDQGILKDKCLEFRPRCDPFNGLGLTRKSDLLFVLPVLKVGPDPCFDIDCLADVEHLALFRLEKINATFVWQG